jgi:hypothetical protein
MVNAQKRKEKLKEIGKTALIGAGVGAALLAPVVAPASLTLPIFLGEMGGASLLAGRLKNNSKDNKSKSGNF